VPREEVALIQDDQTPGTLQDQTPSAARFWTDEHDLVTIVCLGREVVCGLHRVPNRWAEISGSIDPRFALETSRPPCPAGRCSSTLARRSAGGNMPGDDDRSGEVRLPAGRTLSYACFGLEDGPPVVVLDGAGSRMQARAGASDRHRPASGAVRRPSPRTRRCRAPRRRVQRAGARCARCRSQARGPSHRPRGRRGRRLLPASRRR